MEKYFLKISSLAIATIPMVAMVACSEDNSKKCSEVSPAKPLTLKQVKAKFVNANSTKEKIDINLPAVNTTIDPVDLYSVIGYEVPTGIPDTFTITYKLSTNWKTGADDEKFDIEVLITQGAVKETKIFTIIAKDYHFTQARAKIIRKVTSTKMKIEIGDLTISDVQKDDFDKIGYETPTNLPPSVNVKSYTIASKWKKGADANKFDIKLILKKDMHESKPILVTMTAKEFSMAAAKALIKDANSSKTKTGITIPPNINTVVKGDVIGYTPPFTPIDGVVLTYKWKSVAWEGISNNEFKIEVTIAKTGIATKKSKIITITTKP